MALLLLQTIDANAAKDRKLIMEEFMVPAVDPGIHLYVGDKHPEGMKTFRAEEILLFVHGTAYPSEAGFDMKLNSLSWMDYIAREVQLFLTPPPKLPATAPNPRKRDVRAERAWRARFYLLQKG